MSSSYENIGRGARRWPGWIDDILAYPPIAELEPEWRASIADAITEQLDIRSGALRYHHCTVRADGRTPCGQPLLRRAASGAGEETPA